MYYHNIIISNKFYKRNMVDTATHVQIQYCQLLCSFCTNNVRGLYDQSRLWKPLHAIQGDTTCIFQVPMWVSFKSIHNMSRQIHLYWSSIWDTKLSTSTLFTLTIDIFSGSVEKVLFATELCFPRILVLVRVLTLPCESVLNSFTKWVGQIHLCWTSKEVQVEVLYLYWPSTSSPPQW